MYVLLVFCVNPEDGASKNFRVKYQKTGVRVCGHISVFYPTLIEKFHKLLYAKY
jgi:hypothetical protein